MRNEAGVPMCEWCGLLEASPLDIICDPCLHYRAWEAPARQPPAHSERVERALVLLQGTLKRSARLIRSRQAKEAKSGEINTATGSVRRGTETPRVSASRATVADRGTASDTAVGGVCEVRQDLSARVTGLRWPVSE